MKKQPPSFGRLFGKPWSAALFGLAKNFGLQIFLALLVALYFASAPKTEKSVKSALLNPKYQADQIELFEPGQGRLVLTKAGSFWLGQFESDQAHGLDSSKNSVYFSCDSILIQKLLYNLQSIVNLYEISYTNSAKEKFGLRQDRAFSLKIWQKTQVVTSVKFGALDSQKRIALCADKNTKIWSTDSAALAPYLTVSPDFWAAPEIFPKDILGADKKYRHGKLALSPANPGAPLLASELDWSAARQKIFDSGDGNLYRALFLPKSGGDYYFAFEAVPSAQRPQEEKDALKKINAVWTVSAWTFERVFEGD